MHSIVFVVRNSEMLTLFDQILILSETDTITERGVARCFQFVFF